MSNLGSLEKLGILVIVILVVVVGVVAITPKERADELFGENAVVAGADGSVDGAADGTSGMNAAGMNADGTQPLDPVAAPGTVPPSGPVAGGAPSDAWPLDVPVSGVSPKSGATTMKSSDPANGVPVTPPASATAPAGFREVRVKKGETLEDIAKRELGQKSKWTEIVAANPGLNPRRMKIDQVLLIPTSTPTSTATASAPAVAPAPAPSVVPAPAPVVTPAPVNSGTPVTVEPVAPVAASETYKVVSGDSLSDIARRKLGSAAKVGALKAANQDVLKGSDVIRPGMVLKIPAAGGSAPVASAPKAAAPGAVPSKSDAAPVAGGKTYTVQSGDTLSSISARMLGSSSRYREIIAVNEPVLHGSDKIRPGMVLQMPDAAAR